MNRREWGILTALFFLAFFIRSIPHLFFVPVLAGEEPGQFIFAVMLNQGDTHAVLAYPHLHIALTVAIHRLTTIPLETVAAFIIPLFASLSVYPIYFLARNLGGGTPFLAPLALVFLDIHVLRSIHLVNVETMGIVVMLIMLLAYAKRKWPLTVILALGLTQIHLFPFAVGVATIMLDQLLYQGNFKRGLGIVAGLSAVSVLMLLFVFPYGIASRHFPLLSFSLSNFFVFQAWEIIRLIWILAGSTILFLYVGPKLIRKPIAGPLMASCLIMLIGFWLFYTNELVSPYRSLVYLATSSALGIGVVK